jgi:hypothetical protein
LWGDIVRGSYRRAKEGAGEELIDAEDGLDIEEAVLPVHRASGQKGKGKASKKPHQQVVIAEGSESGEFFDLDVISSATEDDDVPWRAAKTRERSGKAAISLAGLPMEDTLASIPKSAPPRKARGRPRKDAAQSSPVKLTMEDVLGRLSPSLLPIRTGTSKCSNTASTQPKPKTTRKRAYVTAAVVSGDDYDGEFFNLNAISADSDNSDDGVRSAPMNLRTKTSPQAVHAGPSSHPQLSKRYRLAITTQRVPTSVAKQPSIIPFSHNLPSSPYVASSKVNAMRGDAYGDRQIDSFGDLSNLCDTDIMGVSEGETLATALSKLSVSHGVGSSGQEAMIIELSD